MKKKIKAIAEAKNIPYLLHFTRLSNLESILENGLLPKSNFDELENEVEINDQLRLDNHEDSVSISISFPNHRMFYKLRSEINCSWVVIVLHPQILWKYDCAFCKFNAADARISCLQIEDLKNSEAFEELFEEIQNHQTRSEQKLKSYDPTNDQAEVLVFDRITTENILGVVFNVQSEKDKFDKTHPNIKTWYHPEGRGIFSSRSFFRKYSE